MANSSQAVVEVIPEINASLLAPIFDDNLGRAVFQLGGSKAFGLNGFSDLFLHCNWQVVGPSFCATVYHLLGILFFKKNLIELILFLFSSIEILLVFNSFGLLIYIILYIR